MMTVSAIINLVESERLIMVPIPKAAITALHWCRKLEWVQIVPTLISFYPETPSVAFRGVGIKKCHFLFLAKSTTYAFDFGGM